MAELRLAVGEAPVLALPLSARAKSADRIDFRIFLRRSLHGYFFALFCDLDLEACFSDD